MACQPLPDLNSFQVAAIDFETFDPELTKLGPGFITRQSYPLGFAFYTESGFSEYYPIGHDEDNFTGPWLSWLKALCKDENKHLIAANVKYELEILWFLGITPNCHCHCIQTFESLIDENIGKYDLDSIALRRGLGAKMELPIGVKKDDLRFVPPSILGPYAERDAWLTYRIYMQQLRELSEQDLNPVADMESKLSKVLMKMRVKGVKVDTKHAEIVNSKLMFEGKEKLISLIGATSSFEPWSSDSVANWLRAQGITHFPKTDPSVRYVNGQDSITNEWLLGQPYETCVKLAEYRKLEKFRRDFVEGVVLETSFKERLHPSWFSTRGSSWLSGGDSNGTRSGRIACVNPNLTQMPSRHLEYGPMLRKLFLPEDGEKWCKMDVSSQEPRIGLHFCVALEKAGAEGFSGAIAMQARYLENPKLDYHRYVTDLVNKYLVRPIERNDGKTINLGLWYGLGVAKLADKLNLSVDDTKGLLKTYHAGVPFVKALTNACMEQAISKGYVRTILGRRRHFVEWENADFNAPWEPPIRDRDLAVAQWGRVKLAGTYKAANSVIQGSAAEMMKKAILDLSDEGIIPLITVYDELNISSATLGSAHKVKECLENAIKFNIPMIAEGFVADNWKGDNGNAI